MKRSVLIKKIDKICAERVKIRDKNICQKCEKLALKNNGHCSHVMSRNNLSIRFDLWNMLLLCYYCHIYWWHREPLEAAEWFAEKFPHRNLYLLNNNKIVKWTESDLLEILEQKKEELKKMKDGE